MINKSIKRRDFIKAIGIFFGSIFLFTIKNLFPTETLKPKKNDPSLKDAKFYKKINNLAG
ncbi:MAG: hypothetical protein KAI91_01460 [Candidatus Omnitrophica bacterium]|nr:hypothetical protein [Candidatus Omnitrophota bacterium]